MLVILAWSFFMAQAQNRSQVEKNLKKLCSKSFAGRGYVKNGDRKAAKYIARKFIQFGLQQINHQYFQPYSFNINSFPKKISLNINEKELIPGRDFIIKASAVAIKGQYSCKYLPLSEEDRKSDLSSIFLVGNSSHKEFLKDNIFQAKGFIYLEEKQPIWSVYAGRDTSSYIVIKVNKNAFNDSIHQIDINIQNQYLSPHESQNVWAQVKGTKYPDSLIIIGAHYDHLGMMGDVIYPGANDNASGTAMLLELARYFSQKEHQADYTIIFAAFSGEEVGLLGSKYMADHFPFNLKNIKAMINLDMVATGSEGITVVNAKTVAKVFNSLVSINDEKQYLKEVKARGESCNSDHCPFYEKGVPAVFIYTRGPEATAYHIPEDHYESLPLTEFDDLFCLLRDFIKKQAFQQHHYH